MKPKGVDSRPAQLIETAQALLEAANEHWHTFCDAMGPLEAAARVLSDEQRHELLRSEDDSSFIRFLILRAPVPLHALTKKRAN